MATTRKASKREMNRRAQKALAYLAMKPRLVRAFDAWAASTPATEKAAADHFRATSDAMRTMLAN